MSMHSTVQRWEYAELGVYLVHSFKYMLSIYCASVPRVGRWTEQMKYLLSWTLALGWQLWLLLVPALCDSQLFFSVAGLATHFKEREHSQSGGMSLLIRSQKTNFHLANALSLSVTLLLTPVKGAINAVRCSMERPPLQEMRVDSS